MTIAWAAQIFSFSTATFGASFTAWVLSRVFRLLHLTISPATFALLHHLIRKSAHFTEYAILSMLLYYSLAKITRLEWRPRPALWSLLIAVAYSLTDELHQMFVPGRGPSIFDSGIDSMGAAAGIVLIYFGSWMARRRLGPRAQQKILEV
jgi:VanZ family protein